MSHRGVTANDATRAQCNSATDDGASSLRSPTMTTSEAAPSPDERDDLPQYRYTARLASEHGIICGSRAGGLRISLHAFNSSTDIEHLVAALG